MLKVFLGFVSGEEEQNVEIKLRTFGTQVEKAAVILIVNACSSRDIADNVVGVCFVGQDVTGQKLFMDKFTRIQGDYKTIVQNPHPLIPPIFGADEFGSCSEWNPAMENLSGWKREEVKTILPHFLGMCNSEPFSHFCHKSSSSGYFKVVCSIIGFERFSGQCHMLMSDIRTYLYHKFSFPTDYLYGVCLE